MIRSRRTLLAFTALAAIAGAPCRANGDEPIVESPITAADREHWAFRPVVRPDLPTTNSHDWPRTSIDAFILAKLEGQSLRPSREASRQVLLRRLSFDLRGLPPQPDEIAQFAGDKTPDAFERVVDRLLASPAYGERWAQHWLDLARFAETDGFEHDKVRPEAWKYRDWVIAALNADMPYDEFVTQQIVGDEGSLATTFCLAGPDMPDINDQLERRHNLLNEMTAAVGSVLLGLQMGCAQCHDHKYDPISQADFYRLRAVFEPAVPPLKRDVPVNLLSEQKDSAPARFWIRGDHRRPGPELQPGFPRIAASSQRTAGQASIGTQRAALAKWLFREDNPLTARVMANRLWQHHFGHGIFETPSDVGLINTGPTHPELLDWLATELQRGGWELKRMHRKIVSSATYQQASSSEVRAPSSAEMYATFPRRRLDGESLRDAMLSAAGLLTSERGGPGVMPPLPKELVGTLLKDQWKTSPREADHYRRSIYLFARRNLRYPLFEAFDRPDANASCPVRNRSTTAPQSLELFNSQFSLLVARHLAGRVLKEEPRTEEPKNQIERLCLLVFSRPATAKELHRLGEFLTKQRMLLAAEARPRGELALPVDCSESTDAYAAAALVDACLALLNASELVYVD